MARSAAISLSVLARRANEAHENCLKGLRHGLQHAIAAGEALLEAKGELQHGEWIPWIEKNCNFDIRTAQRYMRIAEVAPLVATNTTRVSHLTPKELFRLLAGQGPATEKGDKKPPPLPPGKYRVLYADPPWQYSDTRQGLKAYSAAVDHYPTLSTSALCEYVDADGRTVADLAGPDAVLFLWATAPLLPDALRVMEAWGFTYKAQFVWDKVRHNYGHYNSVRHENLLVGVRGSCVPDDKKLFDSVVVAERTTRHSEKPKQFREIIDTLYPSGPRVELFARDTHPGWDFWGNEVPAVDAEGGVT